MSTEQKAPWVQYNNTYFFAFLGLFFFLWIWPAIKTIAAFHRNDNKGRLGYYWTGAAIITALYYIIRPLLVYWRPGAYIVILFSFLSYCHVFLLFKPL